jgi:hypothetical protein
MVVWQGGVWKVQEEASHIFEAHYPGAAVMALHSAEELVPMAREAMPQQS